jgi:hypothetical protein
MYPHAIPLRTDKPLWLDGLLPLVDNGAGASVQPAYPPDPTILGTSIQFFFSEAKVYMEGTILRNPGVSYSRQLSWGDKSHLEVTQE